MWTVFTCTLTGHSVYSFIQRTFVQSAHNFDSRETSERAQHLACNVTHTCDSIVLMNFGLKFSRLLPSSPHPYPGSIFSVGPVVTNIWGEFCLTPLLPQPVKYPGWKMHGRACKQYIFRSYNIYFQCYVFQWKSFHRPVRKIRQKQLRVLNLAHLLVVFQVTSWQWRG